MIKNRRHGDKAGSWRLTDVPSKNPLVVGESGGSPGGEAGRVGRQSLDKEMTVAVYQVVNKKRRAI